MTKAAELAKWGEVSTNGQVSGRRNLIINGDMQINQRGASSVTSGYFVDRFTLSACSASAVLTSSTPTEFPKAISVSATSGNPIIVQKIESKSCQGLSGKTVTASFYAKNISNATTLYASLQYAGSADNFGSTTTISEQNLGSLSGSWVRYTASWTVPSGGLNGLALNILCAGSSTFTMGVTGVQLEVGSVATPFEHRSFGEEKLLCGRYYQKKGGEQVHSVLGHGYNNTTDDAIIFVPLTPEMRAIPTLDTGTLSKIRVTDQDASTEAIGALSISTTDSRTGMASLNAINITSDTQTAGEATALVCNNDAAGYIAFIAEL